MRDYAELVNALRVCGSAPYDCSDCPIESDKCNGVMSLFSKAADTIEELLGAVPKWISVEERLPECGFRCIVLRFDYVTSTPFVDLLWFDGEWWNRIHHGNYAVTHWMPLPEPPKEETK